MKDLEQLANELNLSEERLIHKIDAFLIFAQVQIANLEDAIEQKQYKKIVRYAHRLSVKADKLKLDEIYIPSISNCSPCSNAIPTICSFSVNCRKPFSSFMKSLQKPKSLFPQDNRSPMPSGGCTLPCLRRYPALLPSKKDF